MKVVILGCGPAGIVAGNTIKSMRPKWNVTIIGKEENIFVRCSAPYAIAGVAKLNKCIKPDSLVTSNKIKLIRDEAIQINKKKRIVKTKKGKRIKYDYLIFATGARPFVPPVKGINLKNVFSLRTAKDTRRIKNALKKSKDVVIIGGGMIGVELASLLVKKYRVTIVEMLPHLLYMSYDDEFCERVEKILKKNGIKLILGKKVERIEGKERVKAVIVKGKRIKADVVIFSTGIRPNVKLAEEIGVKVGKIGIKTNAEMRTNVPRIYAIGDCAETFSCITKKLIPSGLVTTAILQAKIAALNIVGIKTRFGGVTNPSVTSIFDYSLGRVGLTERDAENNKIKIIVRRFENLTKYDMQPGAMPLIAKVIFDKKKRIIGAQVFASGNITAGLIDFFSFAIANKLSADKLKALHYSAHPELTPLPFFNVIVSTCEF